MRQQESPKLSTLATAQKEKRDYYPAYYEREIQLVDAIAANATLAEHISAREGYINFIRDRLHALEEISGIGTRDEPGDAIEAIGSAVIALSVDGDNADVLRAENQRMRDLLEDAVGDENISGRLHAQIETFLSEPS